MKPEPLTAAAAAVPSAVSAQLPVQRWSAGTLSQAEDAVAEEMPVALVYHDVPHVVMLATPADLEDYAVGFTLSEGLVANTRGDPRRHGHLRPGGGGCAHQRRLGAVHRAAAAAPQPCRPHRLRAVRGGDCE